MATIQGVWVFRDTAPYTPPAQTVTQAVTYTTADGVAHTEMKLLGVEDAYPVLLNLDGHTVAIYNGENEFRFLTEYPTCKIVDFSDTPQTVSEEFYRCFTQVATAAVTPRLSEKLLTVACNQQRVYDAGWAAGQTAGLPAYQTDVTFAGASAKITLTHRLNTQKFLLIGRVKSHDGSDGNPYRIHQIEVWSPYAYFTNATFRFASGETFNPYEYFVGGDVYSENLVRHVDNGKSTAIAPRAAGTGRTPGSLLHQIDNDGFTLSINNYLLANSTWHFTVIDLSSVL